MSRQFEDEERMRRRHVSPIVDACRQVVRVPINDMGIKILK